LKFIHAADVHLDSPLLGLQHYEGAPIEELRGATRQAFLNLINLAISENVEFVLIAGDLYDGDWKDHKTGLFFAKQMTKLRDANIPVFLIKGNHDAASQITRNLRLPNNVKVFSVNEPESIRLNESVVVHGQGYATRAVTEDLSINYPERLSDYFNIGLLHTSLDGREGHDNYSPCSLQGLIAKDYDYWALGHVHNREVLCEDPWVIFPGNIQGRHIREQGAKGCTLVTVEDGRVITIEHHDLDVLRWTQCHVDAKGADTADDVLDRIKSKLQDEIDNSDGRTLAIRIEIVGVCKAHSHLTVNTDEWNNNIYAIAIDIGGEQIWIEKIIWKTQLEANLTELIGRNDPMGSLIRTISILDENNNNLSDLFFEFKDLHHKLPSELRSGEDAIDLQDTKTYQNALEDVKQLLLTRILTMGDDQ